jgi:hypothetical protein
MQEPAMRNRGESELDDQTVAAAIVADVALHNIVAIALGFVQLHVIAEVAEGVPLVGRVELVPGHYDK